MPYPMLFNFTISPEQLFFSCVASSTFVSSFDTQLSPRLYLCFGGCKFKNKNDGRLPSSMDYNFNKMTMEPMRYSMFKIIIITDYDGLWWLGWCLRGLRVSLDHRCAQLVTVRFHLRVESIESRTFRSALRRMFLYPSSNHCRFPLSAFSPW